MKSPRLLPVVIFAVAALLLFKAVGLVTEGGYVLVGAHPAVAAEADGEGGGPSVDNAAPRTEPTMLDTSPVLSDTSPTLPAIVPAPDGKPAHGDAASAAPTATPAVAPAAAPVHTLATTGNSADAGSSPTPICPPGKTGPTVASAAAQALSGGVNIPAGSGCDALPQKMDDQGNPTTIGAADGGSVTGDTLAQRLAERRAELDKEEAALGMREAVVAAAEKQMMQRADELKSLQAQIGSTTQQKQTMTDDQFAGLIKMYQAMRPSEAAQIFNGLDMPVLLRIVKAIDPRKMSPILAKMTAQRAQELTVQLVASQGWLPGTATAQATDTSSLPQIVGH